MSLDVEINAKAYSLVEGRAGTKVSTATVRQFVEAFRQTGRTRPEDLAPYESFVIPNLTGGFGRYRINSDSAFKPEEYRRFQDSTCDTRWFDSIYLPILVEASSTTAGSSTLDVIRASAAFKGDFWSLWEKLASNLRSIEARKYTTSGSDPVVGAWTGGGDVSESTHLDATSSGSQGGTTSLTVAHTCSGPQRLLVVGVQIEDGTAADPSGVTYNGDAMTKAAGKTQGDVNCSTWYKVAPATGANNIVVTIGYSARNVSLGAQSFVGVLQSDPVGTTANASHAGSTAPSVAATTVAGQYVFDNMVALGSGTATVHASQTQISNLTVTSNHRGATSRELATGTSTTMSWTLASSVAWAILATPIKLAIPIGLDLIQQKDRLVALTASEDDHITYASTDGAAWTNASTEITAGLLDSAVTANEYRDAGLLSDIGGELVAAVWHEDDSTITFFSAITTGTTVTWRDEAVDISSGSGPKGIAVYQDIDGEQKLYVGTREGLWKVDTAPSTWTMDLVFPMPAHDDNCRRMTVHQGALWFAQGVDNSSPAPIYRMTVSGDARLFEAGYGLASGDGVPSDMLGPVKWMKSTGEFLFISVGGGAASRNARILAWNGKGWHHMAKDSTANQAAGWLDFSAEDDGTPRLHFSQKADTDSTLSKYLGQPLVNPRSGVTIKRAARADKQAGHIVLPYYDFGIPQESKNFTSVHVIADDLNSSASNEYITVKYGHDGADRDDTTIGNFTSATTKRDLASTVGQSAKNIGLHIDLYRRTSGDNPENFTPKLRDIVVEGYISPTPAYEHRMTIDLEQTARETGQSVETVIANLATLISTVTQVTFKFGQVSKLVAVDRDRSSFSYGIDSWEVSGAPSSFANRTGTADLVLIEKIATT